MLRRAIIILRFICAVLTRILFIILSLIGVWRVTKVKEDNRFWCLSLLCLLLIVEMVVSFKTRKGKDYRRFSPAILVFLITMMPSIWILELHHQQNRNNEAKCMKFHSWDDVKNVTLSKTSDLQFQGEGGVQVSVCPDDWILGLHIFLLLLLIVGKWLLPLGGGITRDELSQLLLIYVGTAADILEFSNDTLSDVKESSPELVYVILGVWTLSMLQFIPHLAVVTPEESVDTGSDSLLVRRSTDMWNIMESLFIHDGPFLLVRLIVLFHYQVFHLILLFFTIKNLLVVLVNLYRLGVMCYTHKHKYSGRNYIC